MSLNTQGFVDLERISRDILWGKNELGEHRKPLVSWTDIAISNVEGGVGIENLYNTSLALKMRWCGCLFTEDDKAWTQLAWAGVARSLNFVFHRRMRRRWTATKAFLLDDKMHIPGSPLLRDLFKGFNLTHTRLYFQPAGACLPSQLTIEQLMLLFNSEAHPRHDQVCSVLGILRLHWIFYLGDLCVGEHSWRSVLSFHQSNRDTRQGVDPRLRWLLDLVSLLPPGLIFAFRIVMVGASISTIKLSRDGIFIIVLGGRFCLSPDLASLS